MQNIATNCVHVNSGSVTYWHCYVCYTVAGPKISQNTCICGAVHMYSTGW